MTSIFNQLPPSARAETTMDLLDLALEQGSLRTWARRLDLSDEALRTARFRRRLSPVIAGALAEELQQDPAKWIIVAALETERESACKTKMLERFTNSWPAAREARELGSLAGAVEGTQ
ncbi:hypothetical protein J7E62_14835 [Variovorax paradoxus]|nr:hypothetical protein [Variovorax paradoxus]